MARDHRFSTSDETALRENTATFRWQVLRRHVEDGTPLTQLASLEDIGVRTLQRWLAAYRQDGVAGLLPVVPKRARRTHPELQTLIEGLALSKPKLSIAAITRKAQAKATQQGWPMVSYSTVRAIVTALDPGMVTLAHQGSAAYRDNYEMIWRHRAEQPNATWQADHTELHIVILDTNQQPVRPWMTGILDDHSRAECGYMVFVGAPSAMNTALALRHGIWPKNDPDWPMCGVPDRLYVDHGPDFTSDHLAQTA